MMQSYRPIPAALAVVLALFFFSFLWAPRPASAALDLQGTRSIGMGGGLRASATGESAVLLNPAGLALIKTYSVNALYQFRFGDKASLVNGSVVDSVTSSVAAGVFYSFRRSTPSRAIALKNGAVFDLEETLTTHEAGLSLAYPLGSIAILGLTTRYIYHEVEQPEGTPEFYAGIDHNTVSMDFGAILRPWSTLLIAAVGYNLIPLDGVEYPIQLGLGLAYSFGSTLLLEFDSVIDFTTGESTAASFHGGAEVFVGKMVALRGGAMHDMVHDATYVTGGIGLLAKKIALDVGFRQMVDGGPETLLAVSIRAYLQ